jgi:hypothetical protein
MMDNTESQKTIRMRKYGKCKDKDKKEEFHRTSNTIESRNLEGSAEEYYACNYVFFHNHRHGRHFKIVNMISYLFHVQDNSREETVITCVFSKGGVGYS